MELRPYQQEAVDAVFDYFGKQRGNPLVVVPTGGGKSVILSEFIRRVLADWARERILVVTHVRELIDQNYRALLRHWPEAPAGIYSAGLKRREAKAQVLFCGIQSVYEKADKIEWADLILVDEAHLIPARGFGMYRRFLADLRERNQHVKLIGLTATPYRTDTGSLMSGEDRIFDGIAYNCDITKLIEDGYLSRVTARGGKAKIDTSDVHLRGGEFIESELQAAATQDDIVERAVDEIVQRGEDRKSWLVFCCGVEHANKVTDQLIAKGIPSCSVFGSTPMAERDALVAAFREGKIRALVNVGVLTTGFDAPGVDLIALLRPTMSPGLYVQMVGRGLRLAPGKTDCLVLDFGGNVLRHGPIDQVQIREPGSSDSVGEAPVRECPNCQMMVAAQHRVCPECGYEFPTPLRVAHADRPDEVAILSTESKSPFEKYAVSHIEYRLWQSNISKPPTMRVDYVGGLTQRVSEWVCLEHQPRTFPRRKAETWWLARGGRHPIPCSVREALDRRAELRTPIEITVDTRGDYPSVVAAVVPMQPGDADAIGAPPSDPIDYSSLPF